MAEPDSFGPPGGPAEILAASARRYPDKVALVTPTRRLTYAQLDQLSTAVAAALLRRGIGPGDVVSLYGQNSWEWIVSYHGALRAGAIVNPVNVMLTADELAYVLHDCGAEALFAGADQLDTALSVTQRGPGPELVFTTAEAVDAEAVPFGQIIAEGADLELPAVTSGSHELCAIAYTSGTTGHPTGVMQSYLAVFLNCALTATMHGRTALDVVVTALPMAHVYGNVVVNGTFLVGGTVVLMERFNAATALHLIGEERATMFEGVPAMYSMMLADPEIVDADLASLRVCIVSVQTSPLDLLRVWEERSGAPLLELWGMTEITGLGITHSRDRAGNWHPSRCRARGGGETTR